MLAMGSDIESCHKWLPNPEREDWKKLLRNFWDAGHDPQTGKLISDKKVPIKLSMQDIIHTEKHENILDLES